LHLFPRLANLLNFFQLIGLNEDDIIRGTPSHSFLMLTKWRWGFKGGNVTFAVLKDSRVLHWCCHTTYCAMEMITSYKFPTVFEQYPFTETSIFTMKLTNYLEHLQDEAHYNYLEHLHDEAH